MESTAGKWCGTVMGMEEFYPMPMFVNLEVSDLATSVAWYRDALGFRVVFESATVGGTMAHIRREKYQDLLLFPARFEEGGLLGQGVVIQFQAGEESVAEIAARARAADSKLVEGPVERPWNVRDVTIADPDGYRLRFSEVVDMEKRFNEVVNGG